MSHEMKTSDSHQPETHSLVIGYVLWIFGFLGSHRFYYGKPMSGTIYFFTLGLLFIGWIFDLFYMRFLEKQANLKYEPGEIGYNITWILLTFLGVLGIHRFYMRKWVTGIVYLLTMGVFGFGILYDFLTLNQQIQAANNRQ